MIKKEIVLKILWAFCKEKPTSTGDNKTLVKVVVNTESAKDMYKAKTNKYKEKLLDYDEKYSWIRLSTLLMWMQRPFSQFNRMVAHAQEYFLSQYRRYGWF